MNYFNSQPNNQRVTLGKPTQEQIDNIIEYKALNECLNCLNFNMHYYFSFYENTIQHHLQNYICDDLMNIVLQYLKPEQI